jgi:hypothetical protein
MNFRKLFFKFDTSFIPMKKNLIRTSHISCILNFFQIMKYGAATLLLLCFCISANCTVWQVGPARTYTVPSAVAGLVNDGDTVQIDAGTYTDCANWSNNNLLLQGVGNGYAHCQNAVCGYKGIWNIDAGANNITIENMEFSGASISGGEGGNGAGLRAQGGSFTVRNCYFHNNQDGILCNPTAGNDSADVLIEYSVFAYNGCANNDSSGCNPGYEHNMYIGSGYRSFTIMYSYTHGAINGHNIKTRANNNYILYNSIMDLADGTSSYDIDIAQGGPAIIMGNLIEGGPNKVNNSIICYNEGSTNAPPENLYLINNTIVNDQAGGYFLYMPLSTNDTLTLINNIIAGPGSLFNGSPGFTVIDSSHNLLDSNIAAAGLVDAANYNYNLTDSSPAINAGINPGAVYDISPITPFSLTPIAQYVDSAKMEPRSISGGIIDIGAYEYPLPSGIVNFNSGNLQLQVLQNPSANQILFRLTEPMVDGQIALAVYDVTGRVVFAQPSISGNQWILYTSAIEPGVYIAKTQAGSAVCSNKFIISK